MIAPEKLDKFYTIETLRTIAMTTFKFFLLSYYCLIYFDYCSILIVVLSIKILYNTVVFHL